MTGTLNAFNLGCMAVAGYHVTSISAYFFIPIISLVVVISAVLFDLFSKREKIVKGKIVNKTGRIIKVITDKGELKKYKIFNREVRAMLEPDQNIELTLTKLSNYPIKIRQLNIEKTSK